jgi:hypothetical protein
MNHPLSASRLCYLACNIPAPMERRRRKLTSVTGLPRSFLGTIPARPSPTCAPDDDLTRSFSIATLQGGNKASTYDRLRPATGRTPLMSISTFDYGLICACTAEDGSAQAGRTSNHD